MCSWEKLREIPSTFSLKDLSVIYTVYIRRQDYESQNYEANNKNYRIGSDPWRSLVQRTP